MFWQDYSGTTGASRRFIVASAPHQREDRPVLANIPATQTVIEIKAPGGPEVLVPATRPVPEPKAGEVLIRIAGAGVNRADCLQRHGTLPDAPRRAGYPGPRVLGHGGQDRRGGVEV